MSESSSSVSEGDRDAGGGSSIELSVPITDDSLFKYGATSPILNVLSDNPDLKLSIRQLASLVDYTPRSTRDAVAVLEANNLVVLHQEENAKRAQINRSKLSKAEDPILSIPQTEFQFPVRLAKRLLEEELGDLLGILLFGSVARGEADRTSDIDLWVLVEDDGAEQQHTVNKLASELGEVSIPAAVPGRAITENSDTVAEESPQLDVPEWDQLERSIAPEQGQRYNFEFIVETPATILSQQDRVDEELFVEGITLVESEELRRVKRVVLNDD